MFPVLSPEMTYLGLYSEVTGLCRSSHSVEVTYFGFCSEVTAGCRCRLSVVSCVVMTGVSMVPTGQYHRNQSKALNMEIETVRRRRCVDVVRGQDTEVRLPPQVD
jgi:hypothetical protein